MAKRKSDIPADELIAGASQPSRPKDVEANVEMDMGGNAGDPSEADYVVVWSCLPHPYRIRRVVSKYKDLDVKSPDRGSYVVEEFVIRTGVNRVPKALWEHAIRSYAGLQKRLDHGFLVDGGSTDRAPNGRMMERLMAYSEGHPLDAVSVFGLLWDRSERKDPADNFTRGLESKGFKEITDDSRLRLGAPIIAGQ